MMRYLILNSIILAIPLTYALIKRRDIFTVKLAVTALILLTLTAIFDNFIIMADIVAYRTEHIVGLYIYKAPIEDFFYTLAVTLLVPLLWKQDEKPQD